MQINLDNNRIGWKSGFSASRHCTLMLWTWFLWTLPVLTLKVVKTRSEELRSRGYFSKKPPSFGRGFANFLTDMPSTKESPWLMLTSPISHKKRFSTGNRRLLARTTSQKWEYVTQGGVSFTLHLFPTSSKHHIMHAMSVFVSGRSPRTGRGG